MLFLFRVQRIERNFELPKKLNYQSHDTVKDNVLNQFSGHDNHEKVMVIR